MSDTAPKRPLPFSCVIKYYFYSDKNSCLGSLSLSLLSRWRAFNTTQGEKKPERHGTRGVAPPRHNLRWVTTTTREIKYKGKILIFVNFCSQNLVCREHHARVVMGERNASYPHGVVGGVFFAICCSAVLSVNPETENWRILSLFVCFSQKEPCFPPAVENIYG